VSLSRNVAVYVVGTGEILNTLGGQDAFIAMNTPEGCAVIDCPQGLAEHLMRVDEEADPPALVARSELAVDLPDAVELGDVLALDVPAGIAVHVDGHLVGTADEEGVEIAFEAPGRFLVQISGFPYAPVRKRVTVD
jgi:hypothetical protein